MNLFGTPGIGTMMAGRFLTGALQFVVFLAGFCLFVAWSIDMGRHWHALLFDRPMIAVRHGLLWPAAASMLAAWIWALGSSLRILRDAKSAQTACNPDR